MENEQMEFYFDGKKHSGSEMRFADSLVTHRADPETGDLVQVVSALALCELLIGNGCNLCKPDWMLDGDQWDTEVNQLAAE